MINLLNVVHLCPHVPTAAKRDELTANFKSASSRIIDALFPPNSNKHLPNLALTSPETIFPTVVDPVNEINSNLWSFEILSQTPYNGPFNTVNTPSGTSALFFWKTSSMILAVAIVHSYVLGWPFHNVKSPQINAIAKFHPNTATGKLKAVMQPINPIGFHYSIIKWFGLSDGKTLPSIILLKPTA